MTSKYVPMIREILNQNKDIRLVDVQHKITEYSSERTLPDSIKKEKDSDWISLERHFLHDGRVEDYDCLYVFDDTYSYKDVYDFLKKYIGEKI